MCATPLNVSEENLTGRVFRVSGRGLLTSMSINEGASGSLKSYYGLEYRNGLLAWGDVFIIKTFAVDTSEETYSFGRSIAMV